MSGGRGGTRPLIALVVAVFGYALMQTVVVPALTVLQVGLDTTPAVSAWILTAFLLSSAVLTPVLGRLGDQRGKRRVALAVLAVYAIGMACAAASQNIGQLIAARVLQGAALALVPLSMAILREALPRTRLPFAMGLVSGVVGAGAGAGLIVGGLLADHLSWRWLFVLGAALALVSLALVALWVPDDRRAAAGGGIDLPGTALLGGGLVAVLLALEGPGVGLVVGPGAGAARARRAAVRRARRGGAGPGRRPHRRRRTGRPADADDASGGVPVRHRLVLLLPGPAAVRAAAARRHRRGVRRLGHRGGPADAGGGAGGDPRRDGGRTAHLGAGAALADGGRVRAHHRRVGAVRSRARPEMAARGVLRRRRGRDRPGHRRAAEADRRHRAAGAHRHRQRAEQHRPDRGQRRRHRGGRRRDRLGRRAATPDSAYTALFRLAAAAGALGIAVALLAVRRGVRPAAAVPGTAREQARTTR